MITARYFSAYPSDSTSRWTPCPPEFCKEWLQVHLGCIKLSPSCPFRLLHTFSLLRPARHNPRLWIQRPSSGRRRDFNPPEQCAAQRTLRADPPQATASVLSPRGCLPLCFSLSIDGLVPAVPHKSLCRTHAPYTPAAARPVIRLLTGLSQETGSPLVSTAPDTLTTRLRRVCLRSSFRHSPAPGLARDFSPDAHHHGSLPQQLGLV